LALKGASQGIWHWNPSTAHATLSKDFLNIFGYEQKSSSWIDGTLQAIVHPDERNTVKNFYRELFEGNCKEAQIEYRVETASSEWRWILTKGLSVLDRDEDNKIRVIGIHTDITDRKNTESELRRLELERRRNDDRLRLAAVVERNSDAIVIIRNLEGKVEFVNNSFTKVTGYEPEDVLGKTTLHLHTPKSAQEMYSKMWSCLDKQGCWHDRVEWVCKDQRVIVIDKVISPIFDENNHIAVDFP
jgi:PAS domain S-box-containing protein